MIATGSAPAIPPIPGLDGVDYWTNVEATETTEVPGSLLVLGGGPVGCELAQFFARVGSKVTLVQADDRLLPRDRRRGGGARRRRPPRGRRRHPARCEGRASIDGDAVVLADGTRIPFDPRCSSPPAAGPISAGSMRSASPPTTAASSSTSGCGPPRTSGRSATSPGSRCSRTSASTTPGSRPTTSTGARRAPTTAPIPATIFTDPQVATVGTLEGGRSSTWQLTSTPRLSTYERPKRAGFVKIAADPERRVVTGAVAVGPEAGEWLQQLTLAIRAETPIEVLLDVIQPYPTFSEAVFLALRGLDLDL